MVSRPRLNAAAACRFPREDRLSISSSTRVFRRSAKEARNASRSASLMPIATAAISLLVNASMILVRDSVFNRKRVFRLMTCSRK